MSRFKIHSTAIIDHQAEIGKDVAIGPYSVIGPHVTLKDGVEIMTHCHIEGHTTIGSGTKIFPGAVVGTSPQDKKHNAGDIVYLEIGENNVLREYVMINPGTIEGGTKTVIGDSNLLMAYAHVAHDCRIGNHCILANVATIAGHVTIEDRAIVGGLTGVHQFVRIGKLAMVGGCSRINQDVVPFALCSEAETRVCGVNIVGLRRAGFDKERLNNIKRAFKMLLFSGLNRKTAIEKIEQQVEMTEDIIYLLDFAKSSERGLMGGKTS